MYLDMYTMTFITYCKSNWKLLIPFKSKQTLRTTKITLHYTILLQIYNLITIQGLSKLYFGHLPKFGSLVIGHSDKVTKNHKSISSGC